MSLAFVSIVSLVVTQPSPYRPHQPYRPYPLHYFFSDARDPFRMFTIA